MKSMKLNEAEMANVYGGRYVNWEYPCATTCGPCYEGQDKARDAYKEHNCFVDRTWGM